MKKVRSSIIDRLYWIGLEDSPDGLPVFTHAEVDLLKKHKDTLPNELLHKIFDIKAVMKCSLFELDFNNLPENPRTNGLAICLETIEMLKNAPKHSKKPAEKTLAKEQPTEPIQPNLL